MHSGSIWEWSCKGGHFRWVGHCKLRNCNMWMRLRIHCKPMAIKESDTDATQLQKCANANARGFNLIVSLIYLLWCFSSRIVISRDFHRTCCVCVCVYGSRMVFSWTVEILSRDIVHVSHQINREIRWDKFIQTNFTLHAIKMSALNTQSNWIKFHSVFRVCAV